MQQKEQFIHILPHGRQVKTISGKSLLEALIHQSIFLKSDCGGNGTCGKCKVWKMSENGSSEMIKSCMYMVTEDISIKIPETSMLSSHIMSKADVFFPDTFKNKFQKNKNSQNTYGIAVDLGTTTIAFYLCNTAQGKIISSLAVKNPQTIYGDDVMSRIVIFSTPPQFL